MKKFRFIVLIFAAIIGFTLFSSSTQSVSAKSHYKTTPVSLRGKWTTHRDYDGNSQYLRITKYKFYVANYRYGRKQSGAWGVSGKKFLSGTTKPALYVSKHKGSKGYWAIGGAGSDGIWHLKAVRKKHNGHKVKVLKSYSYDFDYQGNVVGYYYRK
ncbi:hypothetical protein C5L31_001110 [Secundilactobacillus malefermentans]|uniref:Uncharacterized protein n=1 Tax=Secundilactobacillus malefermentans TaxID=176292 RepID=A0A4R5NF72_9LACO|nr:hypothetical protein [Secundilactobacillus malefermentans]KRM57952.1 hypothetical protein FD44_GL000881 [Secundilactobacillus malefermentans DSM 5705 = KCTC 3548]TDG72411.1 hypothetical protein C5L31_001110 [Secundilactobacillus malefermentans]